MQKLNAVPRDEYDALEKRLAERGNAHRLANTMNGKLIASYQADAKNFKAEFKNAERKLNQVYRAVRIQLNKKHLSPKTVEAILSEVKKVLG